MAKATGAKQTSTTGKSTPSGGTLKAPGQGAGPRLQGGDNEIGSSVPSRVLTTRVTRRACHTSGSVAPGKLVDYSKGFGVK